MLQIEYGTVENIDEDSLLAGRMKVRVDGVHIESKVELPTMDLPWAQPLHPTNSAGHRGIGYGGVGVQVGSRVLVFFRDPGRFQQPIVLGSIPGLFLGADGSKIPPTKEGNPRESDLGRLATHNLIEDTIIQKKRDNLIKNDYIQEPVTPYNTVYPYNDVMGYTAGHYMEYDSTPDAERIHFYHCSGSFVEFHPDGKIIIKGYGDIYHLTYGNNYDYADGDRVEYTGGSYNEQVYGSYNVNIGGKLTQTIHGGQTIVVKGSSNIIIDGSAKIGVGGDVDMTVGGDYKVNVGGNFNLVASNVVIPSAASATGPDGGGENPPPPGGDGVDTDGDSGTGSGTDSPGSGEDGSDTGGDTTGSDGNDSDTGSGSDTGGSDGGTSGGSETPSPTLDLGGEPFVCVGSYGPGLNVTSREMYVTDGNDRWVISKDTPLPYVTTGAGLPEGGNFIPLIGERVMTEIQQTFMMVIQMINNIQPPTNPDPEPTPTPSWSTVKNIDGSYNLSSTDVKNGNYLRATSSEDMTHIYIKDFSGDSNITWTGEEVSLRVLDGSHVYSIVGVDGVKLNPPPNGSIFVGPGMSVTLKAVAENEWDIIGTTIGL